jgi:HD superfamily phosphohydrolase
MAPDSHRTYEIRCPVYGFITISDWEREIISQPAFQRLRRIRQLSWTDYIYPGAMHTRFAHSLGVMHMATMLYRGIVDRSRDILKSELGYNDAGLQRHEVLIRLAALFHDIGHSPFSHGAEELFPLVTTNDPRKRFRHEQYSAEIVRRCFADVISNHPANTNYEFRAEDVANLLEGKPDVGKALFWRDLIDGQMDADRMDYLLRDSLHSGVDYGRYDWRRLVQTIAVTPKNSMTGPRIGVREGGWHAAEGLILARYFMFTQVYFHKTRVIFDYHLQQALMKMLPNQHFPKPVGNELDDYLRWDDWAVLGRLAAGEGGDDGIRLATRRHYRMVAETPEVPNSDDLERLAQWRQTLGDLPHVEIPAEKSWYRIGLADIPVITEDKPAKVSPLSQYSSVVRGIEAVDQRRLYVPDENRAEARHRLQALEE